MSAAVRARNLQFFCVSVRQQQVYLSVHLDQALIDVSRMDDKNCAMPTVSGIRLPHMNDEDLRALLDQLRALILLVESMVADGRFERCQRMMEIKGSIPRFPVIIPVAIVPTGAFTGSAGNAKLRTGTGAPATGGTKSASSDFQA